MNNFKIVGCDTDSIMFCKPDGSPFSHQEQEALLTSLNSQYPTKIKWEHDGIYSKVIYLKAKNYILKDEKGKVKTKGSATKDQKKEPALKEFIAKIINAMLEGQTNYVEIYNQYIKEAMNVTDIKRWASKKTYTEKLDSSERTNEVKVKKAMLGTDYRPGDKIYVFFSSNSDLCLVENFTGDYHKDKLLEKVFKTSQVFSNVLPTKEIFLNYKLKKNKAALEKLLTES